MVIAAGVALLNCVWLIPFHSDAIGIILGLNVTIAVVAASGWVALSTFARRRPEVVVFVVLAAVDTAIVVQGLADSHLAPVAVGFLLLLPTILSLVIPWATRVHASWLVLHAALAVGYAVLAPVASIPGGAREQLLGLLVVALVVSQLGHVIGLRGGVLSFSQIERIRALNRQARRDRVRVDRLNAALGEAAATDPLTGLGNRMALDAGLAAARSRIARHDECYGLLILDLDRFKAINDDRGHLGGDAVLQATSQALLGNLRAGDRAYRYGGEEFVVLMRVAGLPEAMDSAERIRRSIENLRIPNPGNLPFGHLTTSVGVTAIGAADLPDDDESWLTRADAALYSAKANGRNRFEVGPRATPASA